MMVFFFICWTLYYIFVILFELLQNVSVKNIQEIVHVFCHYLLPYFNTALNPLILFAVITNYRQGLKTYFHLAAGKCRLRLALRDRVQEENVELPNGKQKKNAKVPGSLILNKKNVQFLTLFSMGVGGGGGDWGPIVPALTYDYLFYTFYNTIPL